MTNATATAEIIETRNLLAQEIERGQSFAFRSSSDDAAALVERLHWHELGARLVVPAMAAQWDGVLAAPPSRYDAEDRAKRDGVSALIVAALDQLELAAGVALDFTGLPLTSDVVDAVVRLADRRNHGLIVIAENEDASTLSRMFR